MPGGTMKPKDLALYLHDCGFNVVAATVVDDQKRPYIPLGTSDPFLYQHLKQNRLSKERLLAAIENIEKEQKQLLIGIFPGPITEGKYAGYSSWGMDFDDPKNIEILDITLEKCKKNGTWFEKSMRKGFHLYGITKDKVENEKNHDLKIELFGEGSFIVVYGKFEHELYDLKPNAINGVYEGFKQKIADVKGIKTFVAEKPIEIENIEANCIKNIYKGGLEANTKRNETAFAYAQYLYYVKKLPVTDVKTLMFAWDKRNKVPLGSELSQTINSALKTDKKVGCKKLIQLGYCPHENKKSCSFYNPGVVAEERINNAPKTREEVYTILRKWLHLTDTNYLDLQLGTVISIDSPDPPLWVILLGASGDSKTTTAMGLDNPPKVKLIDQITPNTLASGMKNAHDFGEELQNSSHVLLIPDLACFSTLNTDDKKTIWGQFRTLHDGFIVKRTGNDVSKMYKNCHVSLLACGVPSFKNEQIVKDQLGTRELIYTLPTVDKNENLTKVRKAISHRNFKEQMEREIKDAMQGFLQTKKFNPDLVTPSYIQEFIEEKIFELALFRATAQVDYYEGEIYGSVDQEVPTRVAQQFDLLYRALHSLDENYPDEKYYSIVENMVNSSSVPLRKEIYGYMNKEQKKANKGGRIFPVRKTVNDLSKHFNKSRKAVKIQCLILVELGILTVEYEEETLGRSSFTQEVAYYSLKNAQKTIPTEE